MRGLNLRKALSISALLFLLSPAVVLGQYATKLPDTAISQKGFQGVVDYINQARNWLFGILIVVVVAILIYAAFLYLTSGGDEEKTTKARKTVTYALVALAVGILSITIVVMVASFFDSQSQQPTQSTLGGNP